jgi:peptide/nickel transport system substrate-binding protein
MSTFELTRRAALGLGVGALAGLRGVTIVEASGGTTLRARIGNDVQIIDPGYLLTSSETLVLSLISNTLVRLKPGDTFDWEMDAAVTCEQVDDTHIAFTLRPGIAWTNGFGEMTAEDVKYSFERIADPAMASPYAGDWALLDHVEVIDALSGVIVMKEPFAPLWYTALPWGSGTIVCKAAVEAMADKRFTTDPGATSGPFVIEEWLPKQRLVMARNELWNGPAPALDRIEILIIDDDKAAELAFEAGDVDVTGVSVSSLAVYAANPPADSTLVVKPSINYFWLGMNVDHPTFADLRVRQAVQYAVDVDAILEGAYFGMVERATGIVAPGLVGHREANLIAARDVEKARALLAEAGVPDGFSCKLTVENIEASMSVAQIIQSSLAEVGIEVEIEPLDEGTFWAMAEDAEAQTNLQMTYKNYINTPDASWATMWFMPDQIGVWNWEHYDDVRFAELHNAALRELDAETRAAMYVEMQDRMEQSGAYVFVTHGANTALYRNTFVPAFAPNLLSWNLRDWAPV